MSQHPPEPSGSHPYQPPQQDPTSSRPDEVGGAGDLTADSPQQTPHQPYDQQVPDGYGAPAPGDDPYRPEPYGPGAQGYGRQGYPGAGPQGWSTGPHDAWQQGYSQQGHGQYAQVPHGYGPQGPGPQGYDGQQAYAPQGHAGPPAPPLSARDETLWAVLAHLTIPFFGFVGPLAVYLVHRDRSPWLRESAVEALNFSLVYTVAQAVSSVLIAALIGAVLMPLVFLAGLVLCILAALAASRHEHHRYPVTVRLVS